jgi:ATP-dependent DNA helicase RecQ
MPTGGGKSICYQVPALASEGLTIVVSPLIALMNDQVSAMHQLGVAAAAVHSNIPSGELNAIYAAIEAGSLSLLYVSPERIMTDRFLDYLTRNVTVSLIAIDEAHCVSVWGNDFRPEYVALGKLKDYFPNVPTIALTATADTATQADIVKQLRLDNAKEFLSSFERHNITTNTAPGQKRMQQILKFVKERKGKSGIIYCLSRKSTETVASNLAAKGYKALAYHARIPGDERADIQDRFQNDEVDIICATIAFGMGIDKPNIRYVIHYNLPKNIEGYYQEIGRAGRDGQPSEALLFYSWADKTNLQKFIDESPATESFKEIQTVKLDRMWQFASSDNCRTNTILNYFGEYRSDQCGHCDNCISPPPKLDGTQYAQMALSAIIRGGQRMGLGLLVDVLRGSYRQDIKNLGLDQIKTFGVGREIPYLDWSHYITQFINQGIIQLDVTDYSRLKTTPLSEAILTGSQTVEITEFKKQVSSQPIKAAKPVLNHIDIDRDLLKSLKEWRTAQAKDMRVPPYRIFSNKTLDYLAAERPMNKSDLLDIDGIGNKKLEMFGDQLIEIIESFEE